MDTKPSKSKGHLTPLKHPAVEALVSYSLEDARVRDGHQRITTGHLTPLKHPAVEALVSYSLEDACFFSYSQ